MKTLPQNDPTKARIIVDPRDSGRDYFIDKNEAHSLFLDGHLAIDMTNTKADKTVYCVIKR